MSGVAEEGKLILRKSSAYYYNQLNFSEYDFKTVAVNTSAEIAEMVATKKVLDADAQQKSLRYKLEKYPICARFDMDNRLFDRCVNVHLQLDKCKSLVAVRVSAIDHKDKFDCKKYAIEKYPDHLALYNSEYLELKELKNKKKDEFIVNKEQEEAVEKRLLELNKLMSGPRLSSTQLLNLRKFEEDKCNLDKRLENSALKMVLENECKGPSKELEDILHL
jgi:hypothetical protein